MSPSQDARKVLEAEMRIVWDYGEALEKKYGLANGTLNFGLTGVLYQIGDQPIGDFDCKGWLDRYGAWVAAHRETFEEHHR